MTKKNMVVTGIKCASITAMTGERCSLVKCLGLGSDEPEKCVAGSTCSKWENH